VPARHRVLARLAAGPGDAAAAADRNAQQTALTARIARIETAQNSKILELEDLPADPHDPATQAYRARIRARLAELDDEREQLEAQLKTLAKTTPQAADTSLLDLLPLAGDVLSRLPPRLKARLFQVFDTSILWNKTDRQAHRPRRNHRHRPARPRRHPEPQPRRIPRHPPRPARTHGGSTQTSPSNPVRSAGRLVIEVNDPL